MSAFVIRGSLSTDGRNVGGESRPRWSALWGENARAVSGSTGARVLLSGHPRRSQGVPRIYFVKSEQEDVLGTSRERDLMLVVVRLTKQMNGSKMNGSGSVTGGGGRWQCLCAARTDLPSGPVTDGIYNPKRRQRLSRHADGRARTRGIPTRLLWKAHRNVSCTRTQCDQCEKVNSPRNHTLGL